MEMGRAVDDRVTSRVLCTLRHRVLIVRTRMEVMET